MLTEENIVKMFTPIAENHTLHKLKICKILPDKVIIFAKLMTKANGSRIIKIALSESHKKKYNIEKDTIEIEFVSSLTKAYARKFKYGQTGRGNHVLTNWTSNKRKSIGSHKIIWNTKNNTYKIIYSFCYDTDVQQGCDPYVNDTAVWYYGPDNPVYIETIDYNIPEKDV